ncbi:POK7 protein, partial [Indicator maculatus]|nr:POK7 protein [Indicator maculatus]
LELKAAAMVFSKWPNEPINVVTDSQSVCNIVQWLDCGMLKEVNNKTLFHLLKALWLALQSRTEPYYVLHVRSHTGLPGFVSEGNARADALMAPAWAVPIPDMWQQAAQSHAFFHQGARALQRQFDISLSSSRDILASCADWQHFSSIQPPAVNP